MEITKVKPECHRKMLLFVIIITIRIKALPGPTQHTHRQTPWGQLLLSRWQESKAFSSKGQCYWRECVINIRDTVTAVQGKSFIRSVSRTVLLIYLYMRMTTGKAIRTWASTRFWSGITVATARYGNLTDSCYLLTPFPLRWLRFTASL